MQYELPETIGARLASSLLCTINSIVSQTPMITISIALKPLYSLNKASHLMAGPLLNQDIQLHFSRAASDKNNPSRLPYWIPSNAAITWRKATMRQVDCLEVAAQVHGCVRPRRHPAGTGISSQVLPSNLLPVVFFRTPPHCLKKNGT